MYLSKKIVFTKGPGFKKYTATLVDGKKINFGDKRYEHYKDSVPVSQGGGLWKKLDHKDSERRKNYRKRHSGMKCKNGVRCIDIEYSPAWFSYHFLW